MHGFYYAFSFCYMTAYWLLLMNMPAFLDPNLKGMRLCPFKLSTRFVSQILNSFIEGSTQTTADSILQISDTRNCSKISRWGDYPNPNPGRKRDKKTTEFPSPHIWICHNSHPIHRDPFPSWARIAAVYRVGEGSESWEICSHISNHYCYFWSRSWVRKQPSPTPVPDSPKASSTKPFMYPPSLECRWLLCSVSFSFGLHPFVLGSITQQWVLWKCEVKSSPFLWEWGGFQIQVNRSRYELHWVLLSPQYCIHYWMSVFFLRFRSF